MLTAKEARAMTIDKEVIVNKDVNKVCKSVAKFAKQGYTSFALEMVLYIQRKRFGNFVNSGTLLLTAIVV